MNVTLFCFQQRGMGGNLPGYLKTGRSCMQIKEKKGTAYFFAFFGRVSCSSTSRLMTVSEMSPAYSPHRRILSAT